MELIQAEMIQVLRKRAQTNQGNLGAKAFSTSYESGRTKIKNIELGKQTPTDDDLKKIAFALGVNKEELMPGKDLNTAEKGILIAQRTLNRFPGLDAYVDMLNKAVLIGDEELTEYIAGKISSLFAVKSEEKTVKAG